MSKTPKGKTGKRGRAKQLGIRVLDGNKAFIKLAAAKAQYQSFSAYMVEAATNRAEHELREKYDMGNSSQYIEKWNQFVKDNPDHPLIG